MSFTVATGGWWLRRRPWHNDHSCPRSSARVATLRRPAWARVDESVALAARTPRTTASGRTPDGDNVKALVPGRGLSLCQGSGGLVDPQAGYSQADAAHQGRRCRIGRTCPLDEGLDGYPHPVSYTHLRA